MEMEISIKHNKNQDVFNKNDDKSKNQTKRKATLHTKCHFVNNLSDQNSLITFLLPYEIGSFSWFFIRQWILLFSQFDTP